MADRVRIPPSAWKPGQSGNPAGKPKGARHHALVALDAIGQEAAEDILKTVVEAAKAGDARCAEILLRRVWPERKGRTVDLGISSIRTAADLEAATAALSSAVASGEISGDEASAVSAVFESHRRAIEANEFERRLAALEAAQAASKP